METVNSFRGYGRMKELAEDYEYRRKTRRRLIVLGVSLLLLIIIIAGAAIGVVVHQHDANSTTRYPTTSMASNLKAVCDATRYPDSCFSSISSKEGANKTTDPLEIFKLSLEVAMDSLSNVSSWLDSYKSHQKDKNIMAALDDCHELFGNAMDTLNETLLSVQYLKINSKLSSSSLISDLQTWLSAAVTDQETCMDGFEELDGDTRQTVASAMVNSTQFTSNSLAIVAKVLRLLDENFGAFNLNRKLLQVQEKSHDVNLSPNVTVAKDGSGDFRTIGEALELVPKKNMYPFVIYVKKGTYSEYVEVEKSKWNVTMFGDGMYKTVVTGNKNKIDGSTTFKSATFIVSGRRFTAMDMGFVNTAGPEKHQAVALRSSADQSVFYRCSFIGFQDTLYTHSLRQYYRECDIVGTVDFIFGDAPVILQNCKIMPRQPMEGQKNTITAQGRIDPNENTGIVIQTSTVSPFDNVTVDTYLGRPWKNYSTTIFMRSEIGEIVDRIGWLEWLENVVPPETIMYAEYKNTGPGSIVSGRVDWPGYESSISASEAKKFGVNPFIQGSEWIPSTGIDFNTIS